MRLILRKNNLVHGFLLPVLGLSIVVASPSVQAQRSYVGIWAGIYPASESDNVSSCALCHVDVGGGGLNPYGVDIANSSAGDIIARIIAVEGADSDGDPANSSNISEIDASTQPGWTVSAPAGVTANVDPPVADANGPYTGTVGQQVQFDGSASFDPDTAGSISAYDWTFGDGNIGTGVSPVHTYVAPGIYEVTLVVTDNGGVESITPSITTASTTVQEEDPIADPNGPYTGTEGVALSFDGSASFDPDGGSITQYDWEFGDGNTGIGITPSHTYAAAGSYTVTLTVVDDEGAISAPAATAADIAVDTDSDGIADSQDNCIEVANGPLIPDDGGNIQLDTDGDNYGNACDPDYNNDGGVNATDLAQMKAAFFSANANIDINGDGDVNAADLATMKAMFFGPPGPSGLVP